jgi:hypothetical protein
LETACQVGLAGILAGVLTYCDLDTVFDEPPRSLEWRPWFWLRAWWWGFVLANAVLAGALYSVLREHEHYFKDMDPWLAALLAGGGYTALVRLQFTTLPMNGKDSPIGIETFYEGLKSLVHRRINRIIRAWRMRQSELLAQTPLADLRQRALFMAGSDALLTPEQRTSTTTWITQTADNVATPEPDRKVVLALYIITEQRPSQQ